MNITVISVITAMLVLLGVVIVKGVPTLHAQSATQVISQYSDARYGAPRTRTPTRKATQTRVPTRKPSSTRVPTRKPSNTRVATKTRTRTPPRPTQTRTRVVTRTNTRVPTTTASTMPTLTPTPTPVSIMPTDTIEFVNVGSSDWRISVNGTSVGVEPVLVLQKNETYTFTVNAAFHPLLLSTDGTAANEYINGVSPTGGSTSTLTFVVPSTAPATLYYVCLYHSSMRGRFEIVTP